MDDASDNTVKFNIQELLNKHLKSKDFTVMFNEEVREKLIKPFFNNLQIGAENTSVKIADIKVDFNKQVASALGPSKGLRNIFKAPVQTLLEKVVKKIENIDESSIDIEGKVQLNHAVKSIFEKLIKPLDLDFGSTYRYAKAVISLLDKITDKFKDIEISFDKKIDRFINIDNILTKFVRPLQLDAGSQYKYSRSTIKLLDRLAEKFEDISLSLDQKVSSNIVTDAIFKTFLKPLELDTNSTNQYKTSISTLFNKIIDKINNINVAIESTNTPSFSSQQENIVELTASIKSISEQIFKLQELNDKTKNILAEKEAEDEALIKKDVTLSDDTLNQLKSLYIDSYKQGDLVTNKTAESLFSKVITILSSIDENIKNLELSNSSDSSLPAPLGFPKGSSKSSRRSRTSAQPGRRPTTTKPQRTVTRRTPAPNRPRTTSTTKRPQRPSQARIPKRAATTAGATPSMLTKVLNTAGKLAVAADVSLTGYNAYNDYNVIAEKEKNKEISAAEAKKEKGGVVGGLVGDVSGLAAGGVLGTTAAAIAAGLGLAALPVTLVGLGAGAAAAYYLKKKGSEAGTNIGKALATDKEEPLLPVETPTDILPKPLQNLPAPASPEALENKIDTTISRPTETSAISVAPLPKAEYTVNTDFDPLISFLKDEFSRLSVGVGALASVIANNSMNVAAFDRTNTTSNLTESSDSYDPFESNNTNSYDYNNSTFDVQSANIINMYREQVKTNMT